MKLLYSLLFLIFFSSSLFSGVRQADKPFAPAQHNWEKTAELTNYQLYTTPEEIQRLQSIPYDPISSVIYNHYVNYRINGEIVDNEAKFYYDVHKYEAIPCVEPTGYLISQHADSATCMNQLVLISSITTGGVLECGCDDQDSVTNDVGLYTTGELICNDTSKEFTFEGNVSGCYPKDSGADDTNTTNNNDTEDNTQENNSTSDTTCKGPNTAIQPVITGKIYDPLEYRFIADSYKEDCISYAGSAGSWDSSLYYPDLNPNCLYVWCSVHELNYTVQTCADELKLMQITCKNGVMGSCTPNGVSAIVELECIPEPLPEDSCDTDWHQSWNGSECICLDGYLMNKYGHCWLEQDGNLTEAEQFQSDLEQKEFHQSYIDTKAIEDANKLNTSNTPYANPEDRVIFNEDDDTVLKDILVQSYRTGSAFERVAEWTVEIADNTQEMSDSLGDISDELDSDTGETDGTQEDDFNSAMDALNIVKNGIDSMQNDFASMQSRIDEGFTGNTLSGGSNPDITFNFHGNTMELPLCSTFSKFEPIAYFLFSIFFTIMGLRFFVIGFMIGR